MPHWRRLERQLVACALALALLKAGNSMAARMAMMAITTSSSMRVKARDRVAKWLRFPTRQTNDGEFGEGTHMAWTCFGSIVLRPLSNARKECGLRPKKAEAVTDFSRAVEVIAFQTCLSRATVARPLFCSPPWRGRGWVGSWEASTSNFGR